MSLKDRMIAAWGALRAHRPVQIQKLTLPQNHPLAQMLMKQMGMASVEADPKVQAACAIYSGDDAGLTVDWAQWASDRKDILADLPGWTACRFFHRVTPQNAMGVFGAVKGNFGIWRAPFDVCGFHDEEDANGRVILPSLTYLPEGLDIGMFADVKTASIAADLAADIDWSRIPPADQTESSRNAWREHIVTVRKLWGFHGVSMSDDSHAHDIGPNGEFQTIPIFERRDIGADKPEKLS